MKRPFAPLRPCAPVRRPRGDGRIALGLCAAALLAVLGAAVAHEAIHALLRHLGAESGTIR
jgi:hypothetical protein